MFRSDRGPDGSGRRGADGRGRLAHHPADRRHRGLRRYPCPCCSAHRTHARRASPPALPCRRSPPTRPAAPGADPDRRIRVPKHRAGCPSLATARSCWTRSQLCSALGSNGECLRNVWGNVRQFSTARASTGDGHRLPRLPGLSESSPSSRAEHVRHASGSIGAGHPRVRMRLGGMGWLIPDALKRRPRVAWSSSTARCRSSSTCS